MRYIIGSLFLFALLFTSYCATKAQWRSRTIYQLLTDRFALTNGSTQPCADLSNYCGGSFQGIINNLDYITGMGFDAIWISPIVTNTPGGYHGYWAQDIYTVNSNFGTAQDLTNLVTACHNAGVWVMLDVVGNHVGPVGFDYSSIVPFNNTSNYHSYCNIQNSDFNGGNQTAVEYCRLAGLPDLDQNDSTTRSQLLSWIKNIISTYDIDGLRIDTIPEVHPDFWSAFAQSAGVFTIGEVFSGDIPYIAPYQGPIDSVLNYPLFYVLRNVFQSTQSMNQIQTYYQQITALSDQTVLGNFVDNHDNPRFLYQNTNVQGLKSALAFTLMADGIPIVYYGDEQEYGGGPDPGCREQLWTNMNTSSPVYQFIATIVQARKQNQIWNSPQIQRYSDDTFYAFTRGQVFVALTNDQSNQQVTDITYHPYSNGQVICNIFYPTQDCITVQNNQFTVYLNGGEVKVYLPKDDSENSEVLEELFLSVYGQ